MTPDNSSNDEATPEPRPPVTIVHAVPTVLVVDDDEAVCRVVARLLQRMGYRAMCAYSARDALAVLEGHSVDLLLTDQVMPEMTGVELVALLHARWPAVPAVLMTGVASVVAQRLIRPTLSKPFSLPELSRCVSAMLPEDRG